MFRHLASRHYLRLAARLMTALCITVGVSLPASADIKNVDREALDRMIRDYIRANPEVVRDALLSLAEREAAERREQAMFILKNDDGDPFLGNPDASFVIYEFSDYNCGYCKRGFKPLQELMAADDASKLVVKTFPILSETSLLAAQAAIAAQEQGVFEEFHIAMMTGRGAISMNNILAAAKSAGADLDRLQADMNSPAIEAIIARTRAAAQQLEISGTPGLVIGRQVIPGAIGLDQMREIIATERAANS